MRKRILSVLLCLVVFFTNVPYVTEEVHAEEAVVATEEEFLAALSNSSASIIQLNGNITLQATTNTDDLFVISRPVTITGGSLTVEHAGIVLGGAVTFQNTAINFMNPVRNAIIANGYPLTLNTVSTTGTFNVDIFCGGVSSYANGEIPPAGAAASVTIQGQNSFTGSTGFNAGIAGGKIFAGSLSDVGDGEADVGNVYAGNVCINIENGASGIGEIYAHGAKEDRSGGHPNEWIADASWYRVTGGVSIYVNTVSNLTVHGATGGAQNALFTYKDNGTGNLCEPVLENVSGIFLLPSDTNRISNLAPCIIGDVTALSVPTNTIFSLINTGQISVQNYEGGGTLVFPQGSEMSTEKIIITNSISGVSKVAVASVSEDGLNSMGNVKKEYTYVSYTGSIENSEYSFVLLPDTNYINRMLVNDGNGNWKTIDRESEILIQNISGLNDITKTTNEAEYLYIPLEVRYAYKDNEYACLMDVPVEIVVNGVSLVANNGTYTYIDAVSGESVDFFFDYPDGEIFGIQNSDVNKSIPVGKYVIDIKVPKTYMENQEEMIYSFTVDITCVHPSYTNEKCDICGSACVHSAWQDGVCTICGKSCTHVLKNQDCGGHVCTTCGVRVDLEGTGLHTDSQDDGLCDICGSIVYKEIKIGETYTVHCDRSYQFVPTVSGEYRFSSESGETNDPIAILYDSNRTLLLTSDDCGVDRDFSIDYSFVAGETYYFEVVDKQGVQNYTITLSCMVHTPIYKVTGQNVALECSVCRNELASVEVGGNGMYVGENVFWFPGGSYATIIPSSGYEISTAENGVYDVQLDLGETGSKVVYLRKQNGISAEAMDLSQLLKWDMNAVSLEITDGTQIWNSLQTTISFTQIEGRVELQIRAADAESGIASINYYVSNEDLGREGCTELELIENLERVANNQWQTYESPLYLTAGDKYVVYVKATDFVGNTTYASSMGIMPYEDSVCNFEHAQVCLSEYTFTYNAMEQRPTVSVVLGEKILVEGVDYNMTFSADVTNAGQKSIMITPIPMMYKGSASVEYTIVPESMTSVKVSAIPSQEYNGEPYTPEPLVTWKDRVLEKDRDYTISYENHVYAGNASIVLKGKGNFTGELVKYFTILDLIAPSVTLNVEGNLWTDMIDVITFGQFYKDGVEVTVTANGTGSPIAKVEYIILTEAFSQEKLPMDGWTSIKTDSEDIYTFTIAAKSKGSVYVRVTDMGGNSTVVNTDGIIVYTDSNLLTEKVNYTKKTLESKVIQFEMNSNSLESLLVDDSPISMEHYEMKIKENGIGEILLDGNYLETLEIGAHTITITINPMKETFAKGDLPTKFTVALLIQDAPYIEDEEDKIGWDIIKEEVAHASSGDVITVDMNGCTEVSGDFLAAIKGKDITVVFDMGEGIRWHISGKSVTADRFGDINFAVDVSTEAHPIKNIPFNVIKTVAGKNEHVEVSLAHNGAFGFTAILSINVGQKNAGLFANLYYYNPETKKLEFVSEDEIAKDGIAEFTFIHASDYSIVIKEKQTNDETIGNDENINNDTPMGVGNGMIDNYPVQILSPQTGEIVNWFIGVMFILLGICLAGRKCITK